MVTVKVEPQPITQYLQDHGAIARLARGIGWSYSHVWNVVNGYQPASERFKKSCAMFLRRPVTELFRGEEEAVA